MKRTGLVRPTGMFLAGVVLACGAWNLHAAELPNGAVPIEYVQGDGRSAYMNTGWIVNPQTDVIQLEFAVTDVQANETIWCARGTNWHEKSFSLFWMGGDGGNLRYDYNAGSVRVSSEKRMLPGVKYTLTATGVTGSLALDNGTRYDMPVSASFTAAGSDGGSPLHLFCSYLSNDMGNRSYFGSHRVYSLKYWRSGELIHDCIPFRSATGNVVGLYDRIEEKGVTRSGAFLAGPDCAGDLSVRLPDQEVPGACDDFRPRLEVRNAAGRLLTPGADYTVDYLPGPTEGLARAHVTCLPGSGASGVTNISYAVRRPVPAAYERLAYIQGDGASWLLTDYLPNPRTDVLSLDFSLPKVETTAFLCARDNGSGRTWSFCTIGSQYRFDYWTAGGQVTPSSRILVDAPYTVTLSNNACTVSCGHKAVATDRADFTGTVNPLMFYAFYLSGPNSGQLNTVSKYKTYVCRAWRSGVLIHEWVPVRRVADGVATLYDTVAGAALAPQGTGAFLAGPVLPATEEGVAVADVPGQLLTGAACTPALDVRVAGGGPALAEGVDYTVAYADNDEPGTAVATVTGAGAHAGRFSLAVPFTVRRPLPAGYERLAYIQGDGKTRLLTDWTVRPREDRLDAEVELTRANVNAGIWCARGKSTSENTFTLFQLAAGTFRWDFGNDGAGMRTFAQGAGIHVGVRYALRAGNGDLEFGDRVRAGFARNRSMAETGGPLMLFASYCNGTENNVDFYSTHRLYGLSVRRNGALARDWVPVKDASGAATLYDVVTGTRLAPLGAGAFIAGPKHADFDLYVRDQAWNGAKPVRPQVAATNRVTGAGLVSGADFRPTVAADAAAGFGVVTATGAEGSVYAGQFANAAFEVHAALPEGYRRLRWVQGDGHAAYLPTDVVLKPASDKLVCTFEVPDQNMSGIFCARGTHGFDRSWSFCVIASDVPHFRFDYASSNMNMLGWGPVVTDHRYVATLSGRSCTLSSGETDTVKGNDVVAETGGPLALLCYYTMQNGVMTPGTYSRAKIHGFRLTRSGALLHDWVPVLTPAGVATLYDLVDGTALTPQGELIAGPAVEYDPPPPPGMLILVR